MKTEIICIMDRSGSMGTIADDAIGGFNRFLKEQQEVPGEARMTVELFDDKFETLYSAVPLKDAQPLTNKTFVPRGSTSLLDAIGRTMNQEGARIKKDGWADKVIVVITTDGGENASKEYTREKIKEMITHAEAHGWSFVFLAANQDAFATGGSMGISANTTQNFAATSAGVSQSYAYASSTTRSLRSGI